MYKPIDEETPKNGTRDAVCTIKHEPDGHRREHSMDS